MPPGRFGKKMSKNFWKNKNVLITGYEGFLGSNLTKSLIDKDARVCGLDIKAFQKQAILTKGDLSKIKKFKGSVENFNCLQKIIKENKIEIIFHLAAEALVGKCLENPLQAFSTNIKGTWNILEASRNQDKIKAIVIASSDKAYGAASELPYKENSPLAGSHPYDVSKSCADLLAYTYFYTYNLPVCVTRCGNIFGPGDFNFSRIVPDTLRSILTGKMLLIRSDGKFTRDYIYVEDIVRGYLMLASVMQRKNLFGEAFNFSNESPISVLKLVKSIYRICAKEPNYKILNQARYEIKKQYLDAGKAKQVLGWEPKYSLEEGLRKSIDWYRKFFKSCTQKIK